MALDYAKCAKEIYEQLGGRQNIVSVAHCATRLRLVTADNTKVNMKKLEQVDGVKGVFSSNGQLQLIIGTGTVNKVYEEFLAVSGMQGATKEEVKQAAAAKAPFYKRMIKSLGDVFVPILPAIVASGLMMGLVEALAKAIPSFGSSDWFSILNLFANTAFVFLPVLIAVSAAKVFGGNIYLGGVIGMIMIHPNLTNAWTVGNADVTVQAWNLLGFQVRQVGFQGHVIPVIIAVWLMSKLEKKLHKVVPEMFDLFVTPLVTVIVTGFLTLGIIGPIFSTAETYVLDFAKNLVSGGFGLGSMAMGVIYPVTVVTGIHHMYNVIEAGMLAVKDGVNIWMPIASAANFAQGAACLAVGLKAVNRKTKAIAIPSSLSAALGITEPAIFGINLRLGKPFIFGMIGGGAGALVGALLGVGASAYGVTGIPGFLITTNYTVQYALILVVSFVVAFALTWLFWKEEKAESADKVVEEVTAEAVDASEAVVADETAVANEAAEVFELVAPTAGTVVAQADISDQTFASGVLGKGLAIVPAEGRVVAPCDGEIGTVADSKHAIGLIGPRDSELLIHVGIDTVAMQGDGFDVKVAVGDMVKKGDLLMTFDKEKIQAAGYSDAVVFLVTNADEFSTVTMTKENGSVEALETVVTVA
ncbi:MAG: glucose PTS transporter subunit IIA [Lachnospiraceae bacterium]|nr:glucose PTS transporter subunit IIA [Lachnospiraceae bacterium]MDY5742599.1 glucose PTS transporter subunit IIA [Lachnospiraceae bacterium]